jgi:phage shock protein A
MDAVAELINVQESRKREMKSEEDKADKNEAIMSGAKAAGIRRATVLKDSGAAPDVIKTDVEYLRHMKAYADNKHTVADRRSRVVDLQALIKSDQDKIDKYKLKLEQMQRSIKESKGKRAELIARAVTAKQEQRLNKMIAGLTTDSTADQEASIEDAVGKLEAKARIASELAGTDAEAAEQEYLMFASDTDAEDEFNALIFGSEEKENAARGHAAEESIDKEKSAETLGG